MQVRFWKIRKRTHGANWKKEFKTNAATEPSGVLFQIHQVVAMFQSNNAK
jgi:hypothetical protein